MPFARQRRAFDEGNLDVEDGAVAGERDVVRGDERQPHAVVGDVRAHALAAVRQPPVLHVALGKLARRGAQDLLAQQLRSGEAQRHRVLELVAEAIRAARLVEPARAQVRQASVWYSSQPFIMTSNARSGVFTCTWPVTSSQCSRTLPSS